MATLTLEHIHKRFGSVHALRGLSLTVAEGEFLVILGPTGAGKTTTLRCVAGLEALDAGRVLIDGRDVTHWSPAQRDLAFVFANYALYPRMTVYENLAFPLRARGTPQDQVHSRVLRVAHTLRIAHLLDRRPAQLSGGEQQRVALGRAIVRRPQAFLMDEPLTNLDYQLRAEMRTELKRIHRELGATFLYVTNDQVEAMSMADRIAVLRGGVLQQVGTPEEIYEQPANLFVATFVGMIRMNLLTCAYDGDSGRLRGATGHWDLPLSDRLLRAVARASDPARLILGIRPEHVRLYPGPAQGLRGHVYVVEPLGSRNVYDVSLNGQLVKVKVRPDLFLPPDTEVTLVFDLDCAHLFDGTSGETLTRERSR